MAIRYGEMAEEENLEGEETKHAWTGMLSATWQQKHQENTANMQFRSSEN